MREAIGELKTWLGRAKPSRALLATWAIVAGCTAVAPTEPSRAAEFGTGPWVKGYTDIFGGIVPPVPGFYFRTDAYHYKATPSGPSSTASPNSAWRRTTPRPSPRSLM